MMRKILFPFLLVCLCLLLVMSTAAGEDAQIHLSHESGFYVKNIQLEATCTYPDAVIHYTLDGSAPGIDAPVYEGAIPLTSTVLKEDPLSHIPGTYHGAFFQPMQDMPSAHAVRFAALLPDGTVAAEAAGTYFIGYESRQALFDDLPIISLMMDKDDLFDYERGIFMLGATFDAWKETRPEGFEDWEAQGNYSNRGREWERPVMVDFMMAEGEQFIQSMGVRIKGGASRSQAQKSMRLIARDDYGKKNIKYPLLPGNICQADGEVLSKYKSINLRNGANDNDTARIRDPLISLLARGMEIETAMNRPAVCFINGEYWGLYTLTEEYSDHHLTNHYGLEDENVITIKRGQLEDGVEQDQKRYDSLVNFFAQNDFTDPRAYAKAKQKIDVKSFADYMAVNLYIANEDGIFEWNNWQMWRARITDKENPYADGRWRMMLYDSDYSSDVYGNGTTFADNTIFVRLIQTEYESYHPVYITISLMENEEFRKELILSLCDVRNLFFEKNRTNALIDQMAGEYTRQRQNTFLRFGPEWIARWDPDTHFQNEISELKRFFTGRYSVFPTHIRQAFRLQNPVEITVLSSDPEKGSVLVNSRPVPIEEKMHLLYFPEYPITLTAQPAEGCTFVGWQLSDESRAALSDPAALFTTLSFTKNVTVTAVFE